MTCSPLSLRKLPDPGFNPKDQFTSITFVWPIKLRMSRSADQVDGKGASLLLGERCVTSRNYPPVPAATIDTAAAAPVIIFPTDKQNIGLHHYLAFFLLVEVISPYFFSFPLVNLQTFVLNSKKLSIIKTIASGHSTLKKKKKKTQANNELHPNQHSSGIKSGCFIDETEREGVGGKRERWILLSCL